MQTSTNEIKIKRDIENFVVPISELASVLVKHAGYHEGLYDVTLHLNMAVGQIGPSQDKLLPGAMFGVAGVGLNRVSVKGENTVDAAIVNPAKKRKAPKSD